MNTNFRRATVGMLAGFSALLIASGLLNLSFPRVFWGLVFACGAYRYAIKAKPLNKYLWLVIATGAIYSGNISGGKPITDALVIAGATGLLATCLVAIYDYIGKPLWRRFGPTPPVTGLGKPRDGKPLIIKAAAAGDEVTLLDLIEMNTDVNTVDEIGATPLMYAARNNQIGCLKLLLEAGADRSIKTKKGYTALWFAENNSHADAVDFLRSRG